MEGKGFKTFVKIEKTADFEKRDIESYGEITLRFGQYKDCRIKDIIEGDVEYAKWVWENAISCSEIETPTSMAIKKYFKSKLNL
tara:strand:+ start:580 stop:831 length:252 start_codon:yes stop_codon:yes gene_type:complete